MHSHKADHKTNSSQIHLMHVVLSMIMGGAEKLVYEMIHNVNPAKVKSSVCCLQSLESLGEKLKEEGIPLFLYERKDGVDWALIGWLRRLIIAEQINVVHAHQYTPMFYTVLATAGLKNVNVIYTEHGRLYPEKWNWKRYLVNPLLSLGVKHIVSISESTKRAMVHYDNFSFSKIKVVLNGVDFSRMNPIVDLAAKRQELGLNQTCQLLGTAARLEDIKNIPMMINSLKIVLRELPDTVLLIAGEGSQKKQLRSLAEKLEIIDNVKFIGLRFDMPEIFKLLDVFLLTSFTEGISITLLEAMASGAPAIVTDVGGNPEVVSDGESGYLVPAGENEILAARIVKILKDDGLSKQLSKQAHARALNCFSFNMMLDKYLELYDDY